MQIQLIRNATLRITYAGRKFVIDPFLAAKHTISPFAGKSPNPLVDLPCPPQDVIADIEMVLVSHLHADHFDEVAQELLPKNIEIFCQPGDEEKITAAGFRSVMPLKETVVWQEIALTRTPGQHGTEAMAQRMGNVSGFVFQAGHELTLYWAGDTIWYDGVGRVLDEMKPDIVITHSCGAVLGDSEPIVMDAAQTIALCRAAPWATVVATHMDALDHATVSRADLKASREAAQIQPDRLLIPNDGDVLTF